MNLTDTVREVIKYKKKGSTTKSKDHKDKIAVFRNIRVSDIGNNYN